MWLIYVLAEEGGWGDHVVPFVPPNGTAGEWIVDPYGSDEVPVGPGEQYPSLSSAGPS